MKERGKKDARVGNTVSAFAAHQRLVLGQVKVADKSNEIVAIPKLLDLLALEGAVVTIDAIGCQREIAGKSSKKRPIMCWRSRAIRAPARRCRSVRRRAEGQGLQGCKGHAARNRRRRPRPHRNEIHGYDVDWLKSDDGAAGVYGERAREMKADERESLLYMLLDAELGYADWG